MIVALMLFVETPFHVSAATNGELSTGTDKLTCPQQINRIRYRSVSLNDYKQSEQKRYNIFHKKWQTRIAYAAQWVPKDAEKTRDGLYKTDSLRADSSKEIDAQIKAAKKLTEVKLDCTSAHKIELKKQFVMIQGLRDGKVVGGNARINQLRKLENAYQSKDFHKQAFHMLDRLHAEKAKHPKPSHPKLQVK